MGSTFSHETHGVTDQKLYDSYVQSPSKFGDLSGKTVAVTGTSSNSLGFYVAEVAVKKNAKMVLLLNRESDRSKKAEEEIRDAINNDGTDETVVKTIPIDLQSRQSVEEGAKEINKIAEENGGLDVLCCNAGVMAMKDERTQDGYEVQMQTNQLSHFLLTSLVMTSLEKAANARGEARVVLHSSSARDISGRMLDRSFFVKSDPGTLGGDGAWMTTQMMGWKGGPWQRYHQTKLANSAFAMAMHDRLQSKGSKVKALSADPGWSVSNLQLTSVQQGTMDNFSATMGYYFGQSPADGSLPCATACYGPEAKSGDFYMPAKGMTGEPVKAISEGTPVKKAGEKLTCHPDNKKTVWDACEEALGMQFNI